VPKIVSGMNAWNAYLLLDLLDPENQKGTFSHLKFFLGLSEIKACVRSKKHGRNSYVVRSAGDRFQVSVFTESGIKVMSKHLPLKAQNSR
jgi:hypothetical protein